MAEENTVEEITLEETPTWAVATVCFVLIALSILIEYVLHLLAKYFTKKRKRSLVQALEKIKLDLMLLGFMSLLLTVSEKRIANICIPKSRAETFLPCGNVDSDNYSEEELKCQDQDKVSLLSRKGVRELQYLIFALAFFHSLSCVLTFSLGMAKMTNWKSWEAETRSFDYQFKNDPRRFQFAHHTSFGKRHLRFWSDEHRFLRWPAYFLRQFYESVSRTDYLTLRHGFIMAHFAEGSNFNFQKYIKRALEKDFGVMTGTSWWIWIFSVLFIFFNAQEFYSYLWLPFIPLVMLLLVGTKLQAIITQMCLDSHDKSHVVIGPLLVRPSDHFFWFNWPKLLLLFYTSYTSYCFRIPFKWHSLRGLGSCFHNETKGIIIRIVSGMLVHVLCGYVTLPLYALVTQMGSSMEKAGFPESVVQGLNRWQGRARKNLRTNYLASTSLSLDTSPSFSLDASYSVYHDSPSEDSEYTTVEIKKK